MPVLIVEDEGPIRNLIAAVLKRERIEADTAENGRDALQLMARRRYSCIILDLMMPVMNGRQLVEWMKDVPDRPPVILLTAAGESSTADLPPEVVKVMIRKPFDLGRVVEVVRAFAASDAAQNGESAGDDARPPLM